MEVRFCRCFIFGRIINVLLMAARIHYVSIWLRSRIRYYKCIERVSVLGEQTPFFVELINLRNSLFSRKLRTSLGPIDHKFDHKYFENWFLCRFNLCSQHKNPYVCLWNLTTKVTTKAIICPYFIYFYPPIPYIYK